MISLNAIGNVINTKNSHPNIIDFNGFDAFFDKNNNSKNNKI